MRADISYADAINEGIRQAMDRDSSVLLLGQLVDSKPGVFGTTKGLAGIFGPNRVIDFPVSESLMTSMSIGLAVDLKRPILVHQRLDFSLYAMDAIVNWMSLWRLKSGGRGQLPITIRAIVGKGWGQGPQHSKSLYSWFGHLPGIRTCVPSNPVDAKGMLLDSIFGMNPTLILENRALFGMTSPVPSTMYRTRLGKAAVVKSGDDLTVVSFGNELQICLRALAELTEIDVELIDLRSIKPLDMKTVIKSVRKTGRLLVVEGDWKTFGVAAEIISSTMEAEAIKLKSNPVRLAYPDSHTPTALNLEQEYYIKEKDIIKTVNAIIT